MSSHADVPRRSAGRRRGVQAWPRPSSPRRRSRSSERRRRAPARRGSRSRTRFRRDERDRAASREEPSMTMLTHRVLLDGWQADQEKMQKLKQRDNKWKQLYADEKEKKTAAETLLRREQRENEAKLVAQKSKGTTEKKEFRARIEQLEREKETLREQLEQEKEALREKLEREKTTMREDAELIRRGYARARRDLSKERRKTSAGASRAVFDCDTNAWATPTLCKLEEGSSEDETIEKQKVEEAPPALPCRATPSAGSASYSYSDDDGEND